MRENAGLRTETQPSTAKQQQQQQEGKPNNKQATSTDDVDCSFAGWHIY